MAEPLILRDDPVPDVLVVVRLGSRTLEDAHLGRAVEETHGRWGLWGFSVLEVPDGDYDRPTLDHPHWTVTLAAPTPDQFGRVRALFRGPMTNPAWSGE